VVYRRHIYIGKSPSPPGGEYQAVVIGRKCGEGNDKRKKRERNG
jgi:hypothetical protein